MKTAKFIKTHASAIALFVLALPFGAAAQEACTTYTVKDGDTLGSIAQAAYGSYDYQTIFNANRDALAASPNKLSAGLQLVLPCEDGRLSADAAVGEVIEQQTEEKKAEVKKTNTFQPPLKFVTANGWAPFTESAMKDGGIFVNLATTAMQRGGNDREVSLAWIDDWGSHIETLLPSGAFDVSVAWMMPDCSKLDLLGEWSVTRCTELDKSLPIYEMAFSYITMSDNKYASAATFSDLAGARICRPKDWELEMLEIEGLVDPFITLVQLPSLEDCAKALVAGEVDVYADGVETADQLFKDLGVSDKITINPNLVQFPSFHFVTSKTNPRGRVYIAMLNKGISEMRETGEWYDIVAKGLGEYNKLSQ